MTVKLTYELSIASVTVKPRKKQVYTKVTKYGSDKSYEGQAAAFVPRQLWVMRAWR
jgi:hypothetical protein